MHEPARFPLRRWSGAGIAPAPPDAVAIEEPLEIRVAGRSVAVVMRTPGHDRELAAGFLLSEGMVTRATDILDVLPCRDQDGGASGNVVNVVTAPQLKVNFDQLTRHVFSSSSCGICGKATLDSLMRSFPSITSRTKFDAAAIAGLPARLRAAQPMFDATGGLHGCALFDGDGTLLAVREDVGRHNAVDKLLGRALLHDQLPLSSNGLLLSGRISFELVQKAFAAGLPIVAGIGAPSSLAIECAERAGITLIGFLRADRFNVYAGADRLTGDRSAR